MARVLTKKSTVPGKVPLAADLEIGELAVNTADAKLFTKHSDNTIKQIGGDAASGYFRTEPITATATGQTSFTVPGGYTPGAIFVSLNGASLPPADFTATNGTTVVLASGNGIVAGSVLLVHVLSAFEVANALPLGGTAADSSKLGGQAPSHYATQAALDAKVDGADVDFTIIYPNGGSAASPANVAVNSRYVMSSPYSGHRVIVIPQLLIGGTWFDSGWGQDSNVHVGVRAGMYGDSLVVQTGRDGISWQSGITGESKPLSTELITTAPCRVTVFKIKGALA